MEKKRDWILISVAAGWAIVIMACSTSLRAETSPNPQRIGPGLERKLGSGLAIERKADLSHVTAKNYAEALGKDPARIFAFLRDEVGYQAYTGALRGNVGTLLGMAGNSLDRALLLAALLEESGKVVRFAHGALSDEDGRMLVAGMWSAPIPKRAGNDKGPRNLIEKDFAAEVARNLTLLQQALPKSGEVRQAKSDATLKDLATIARDHYWVQLKKGEEWIDLDPSFGESKEGATFAKADETFTSPPEKLFHRVKIRAQLEELADGKMTQREVLTFTTRACDLSGALLVFCHRPEGWNGKDELAGALAAGENGRAKPVLMLNEKFVAGKPFRTNPASPGASRSGGVGDMLRGEGSRHQSAVAIAESIEFEFVDPAGQSERVTRQVFDRIGPGARASGKLPTVEEMASNPVKIEDEAMALFFSTGPIDASLFSGKTEVGANKSGATDVASFILRLNATFAAGSDAIMAQFRRNDAPGFVCYPDSPRLQIVKLSKSGKTGSVSLDLRRDHVLIVAKDSHVAFAARMLRGVLDGILERVLMQEIGWRVLRDFDGANSPMSTSLVVSKAKTEGVSVRSLTEADLATLPADASVRMMKDLKEGNLVIAPDHSVTIAARPRVAWWRVNPSSGETIAVTDEGMYGVAVEKTEIERRLTIFASQVLNSYWICFAIAVGGEEIATSDGTIPIEAGESLAQFMEWLFENATSVYDATNGVWLK